MKTPDELRAELDGGPNLTVFKPRPNGAGTHAPRQRRLHLKNFADMGFVGALLTLIKGICGEGQTVVLYGDSGTGKSLIALLMAMCVALGRDFCGRKVKQGFVVYLSPEGATSIALRAHALAIHLGVDLRSIPIRGLHQTIDLCHDDQDVDEIIEGIRELEQDLGQKCVLVIIDTVSRALSGGDENQPRDMGSFVKRCDRLREGTGATVMPIHHIAVGGEEPRGHRSLRNAADIRLFVTKITEDLMQMEVKHAKDGASGDKLLFRIATQIVGKDEDGEPIIGALAVSEDARPSGEPGRPAGQAMTDRQVRLAQELRKQAFQRKSWDFTFDEFADACEASGVLDKSKNDSTRRGLVRDLRIQLANKRVISVDGKAQTVRLQ